MVECKKCGTKRDGGKFCTECGWDNALPTMGGYDPDNDG